MKTLSKIGTRFKKILNRSADEVAPFHEQHFLSWNNEFNLPDILDHPSLSILQRNDEDLCIGDEIDEIIIRGAKTFLLDHLCKYRNLNHKFSRVSPENESGWERLLTNVGHYFDLIHSREQNRSVRSSSSLLDKEGYVFNVLDTNPIKKIILKDINTLTASDRIGSSVWERSADVTTKVKKVLGVTLKTAGILELYQDYLMAEAEIKKAYLIYTKPGDEALLQSFKDLKHNSQCKSFHIDPKDNVAKVLIYLSDVDILSGPFSVVSGSHQFQAPLHQELMARSFATSVYFRNPEERSIAQCLPKPLRRTYLFGDLISDNSSNCAIIRNQEKVMLSSIANSCLFLAGRIIHRGGLSEERPRLAMQVILSRK